MNLLTLDRRYHLKDVIVGKIYFLLVRIKIKHMELSIIRRETTGAAPNLYNESETITKFEIMDGAPVRGETIPIRLFLGGFELTPTFRDVNKKFSTRYYLNLVLIDEENRRYFKQQEVTIFRIPRVLPFTLQGEADHGQRELSILLPIYTMFGDFVPHMHHHDCLLVHRLVLRAAQSANSLSFHAAIYVYMSALFC